MKRFFAILLALVVLGTLITACQNSPAVENPEPAQQRQIRVLLPEHPYANLLMSLLHEFEEETGISVVVEQSNESALTQKLTEEFTEGDSFADVFMTRPMTETLLFLKNDWMMPLSGYDFSDYSASTIEIGFRDGNAHFVPLVVEWQVLYYRKDLLEAAGLSVPTNFEELEHAAQVLNRGGVAGFAARGNGSLAVSMMSSFIYNFGGRYIENGVAAFDSPAALDAIRLYGRLLGASGPPGVVTMSWNELLPIFQAGNLAMWSDASVFYGQLVDPEVSTVPEENVGVASLPRGPVADSPFIVTAWGMSISSMTEDLDSSMEFLKWATSEEMARRAMLANIPMARDSVWNDPLVTANINSELVETMLHAAQFGDPYPVPFMTSVARARELIGEVIIESINTGGTSPRLQGLATQMVAEVNDLLRADGEYGTAR